MGKSLDSHALCLNLGPLGTAYGLSRRGISRDWTACRLLPRGLGLAGGVEVFDFGGGQGAGVDCYFVDGAGDVGVEGAGGALAGAERDDAGVGFGFERVGLAYGFGGVHDYSQHLAVGYGRFDGITGCTG